MPQYCWERDPAKRPTFEEVVNRLKAMLASGECWQRQGHVNREQPTGGASMCAVLAHIKT